MTTESGLDGSEECRRKALDLLARRPHLTRELESKLAARGFAQTAIAETSAWLTDRGLLDDLDCSRSLVAGIWRRKGFGPRRMRAELGRRGVAADTVDRVLSEEWSEGEEKRARETAAVWLNRRDWNAAALARHLERKGFGGAAIRRVVDETRLSTQ